MTQKIMFKIINKAYKTDNLIGEGFDSQTLKHNRQKSISLIFTFILLFQIIVGVFLFAPDQTYAAASTWTGATSTDWGTATNWSLGTVPDSTTDVTIPDTSAINAPSISSGAICNSLTIAANGVLNGNANTITAYGSWTNSGTFNHGSGKVVLTGATESTFTPGISVYNDVDVSKTGGTYFDRLTVSGTATVSGNLVHAGGVIESGQIDLAGNYTVGVGAHITYRGAATIINFNHASNNQSITYNGGGPGAHIRIDKAGGTFSVATDISIMSWEYVRGAVSGQDSHTITFGGGNGGTFTHGSLTYSSIVVNKVGGTYLDKLYISPGTLNIIGNLTVTDGELHLDDNNPTINISGNVIIGTVLNAGTNPITVSGNWTNTGTFSHGSGKVVFAGGSSSTLTPGSSAFYNLESNKTDLNTNNVLNLLSNTVTVSGDLVQTNGVLWSGQINLAGNYTIGASANEGATIINFNHASNNQSITYTAGGIGAQVRIDKAGGTFSISSDVAVNGWEYAQGAVSGVDTHVITFGGVHDGTFIPGALTYGGITLNKTDSITTRNIVITGTATVSGNLIQTGGRFWLGQIDLAGNYTIGANANGGITVINFNHASSNQSIAYTAGGIGAHPRIDKAGGTFNIGSDITVHGWDYIRGTVSGIDNHTITFGGGSDDNFTPGALTYGNIILDKDNSTATRYLTVGTGTLNIPGNLTVTRGGIKFNNNNTTVNISGNVSIAAAGVMYAGTNTITVNGNWTNSGTFNHGNGKIVFGGGDNSTFTQGASAYYDIEVNKTNSNYDALFISGTVTASGNLIHTKGKLLGGQISLAGNYTIGAAANGCDSIVNFNHGSNNQSIIYNGGMGAQIRIDKAGGIFNIPSNITINGWTYVQGTVTGVDTYTITFGGPANGTFTPGALTYSSIGINKTNNNYNYLTTSGTAIVSGNLVHTSGNMSNGQFNLAGNYIIGASAAGGNSTINFNHASNDQSIVYNASGVGAHIRIDKTGGIFSISSNFAVNGWNYVQGTVTGVDTYTITFGGVDNGNFTAGGLTYGNIILNKTNNNYEGLFLSSGTFNISGNLTLTDGALVLDTYNPTVNISGNLSIASVVTVYKGFNAITFNGTSPSTFFDSHATPQNIGSIVINKTNATESQNKLTLASSMTCSTLTVDGTAGQADTLDLGISGYTLTLANAGAVANVLTVNGTLVPGTSITKYTATNSGGSINIAPITYNTLNLAGAETYALTGTTSVNSALTIGATSTLTAGNNTLDLTGNLSNSGTFTAGTGTVNLIGTGQTLTGNTFFYGLNKIVSSADTLTFASSSTTSILAGGSLTLNGNSESDLLSLRSSSSPTQYNLNVNASATTSLNCLDVKDSNATGTALTATNSKNSSNNTNWTITSTSPVLTPVTIIPAYTNDTTPTYTFNSTKAGNITYAGDCTSITASAIAGDNIIIFDALSVGLHNNCTIKVTDALGNDSNLLSVSAFTIDTTAPTITSVTTTTASGNYSVGISIPITVNFSEPVTSTGDVTVTLNTAPVRTCTFMLSNASTGTCNYTVQAGDSATNLNPAISGIIRDSALNSLTVYIPASDLTASKTIDIDTAAPSSPIPTPEEGTYNANQSVILTTDPTSANTYYTLDNTTPDSTKILYTGAIAINGSDGSAVTLKAVSIDTADNSSTVMSSFYSFNMSAPQVTGVTDGGVYGSAKTITFNKGTATLDGNPFTSGSTVSSPGAHILIITDLGGITTINFTISSSSFVPPAKPNLEGVNLFLQSGTIDPSLFSTIYQIAISRTEEFTDASWQDFDLDEFESMRQNQYTLYLKFRTKAGGVSDTVICTANSNGTLLKDGDIVKTATSPDVYIIKYKNNKQYKRLILSPSVFDSYGHLKWDNLKVISQTQMDAYTTSNLVQVAGDGNIYELTSLGDTGERSVLDMTKPFDADAIYEINAVDRDNYRIIGLPLL